MHRRQSRRFSAAIATCFVLMASNQSHGEAIEPAKPDAARPLPLTDVRLTGGPLKEAQDLDAAYLLELEPDRMMSFFRSSAGLEPKAEGYGGWDGGGRNLTGHIAGHYLSAVSLMYATTGDERFKERADYIVAEMKEVQDANGDGYLVALENGREVFGQVAQGEIRSGGFDLNGLWAPWYTLHKIYAGLRDAYRYTGNETALAVEVNFAEWAEGILSELSDEQVQKMLNTEFGGMNEVLADLYADTGDDRWLKLSYKFEHESFTTPLKEGEDNLAGKHGNTQVPKLIGSLDRYQYIGDPTDLAAAKFFWERVAHHHSFATGGHGKDEYFGEPDKLSGRIDGRTAETCNVYNMLKLTRGLFSVEPDIEYAEFHERALFNHILGSIDDEGHTTYMTPVGQGVDREYAGMFNSFTCCVGSGMESHALHADGLYYEAGDKLWVNLYAPSTAEWKKAGAKLQMETGFPIGEEASLTIEIDEPKELTIALRRPEWAGEGFTASVNGEEVSDLPEPGSYVELKREWKSGDKVTITLPKRLHLEPLPDNPSRVAVMWGPLVLAGDLGPEARGRRSRRNRDADSESEILETPVFVVSSDNVSDWIKPDGDEAGTFKTDSVGKPQDIKLEPFYRLHHRHYAGYFDLFTPEQWAKKAAEYAAQQQRLKDLEAATVAYAQPGEMQPERDYQFKAASDESSRPLRIDGVAGRWGNDWFSFEMPVDADSPMLLAVTYHSSEERRRGRGSFDILVNGTKIAEEQVEVTSPPQFYTEEYEVPAELLEGKETVTVRFESSGRRGSIGPVFGVRTVRADALEAPAQE